MATATTVKLMNGVTEHTPDNILLGVGTIHKGLKFTSGKWNFEESIICATSGGSKLSIIPNIVNIPIDNVWVKVKGLSDQKIGEKATMEINPVEVTPELIKNAIFADDKASETATGWNEMNSKERIEDGDYLENMAFVGVTLAGKPIVVIFDWALCTNGLELETKSTDPAIPKFTYECYAERTKGGNTRKLPYHIFYPTPAGA